MGPEREQVLKKSVRGERKKKKKGGWAGQRTKKPQTNNRMECLSFHNTPG